MRRKARATGPRGAQQASMEDSPAKCIRLSIFGKNFRGAIFSHAIDSSPQGGLDSLDNLQAQRWGKAAKIGHGPATVIG
jgi:hypothetical protein